MIEVYIKVVGSTRYELVPGGPFNLTADELREARSRFQRARDESPPMSGERLASATAARTILEELVPGLLAFDYIPLAYAMTTAQPIRIREAKNGR